MTEYNHTLDEKALRRLRPQAQKEVMEAWFRARYEDPAERTPYESAEGGYIWIWGGPHEAEDVLHGEFGGVVSETVISELASELSNDSSEWAPVPSEDDYDHGLVEVITLTNEAPKYLKEALATIRQLQLIPHADVLDGPLCRLLFVNAIAALETYLSDRFLHAIRDDRAAMRRFIENAPEFRKRSVAFSSIFDLVDKAEEESKRYIVEMVWHNLSKVQAMYRDTLRVEMGPTFSIVAKAIPKRHDIVHRNGKDKDGIEVSLEPGELSALLSAIKALADDIERKLIPDF